VRLEPRPALNGSRPITVPLGEMTDQEIRQFVEILAVPDPADPPACPLCGHSHRLESRCEIGHPEVAGLRREIPTPKH
jgi:hypothetical protein